MKKKLGFVGGLIVIIVGLSVSAWAFDVPMSWYKSLPNNWGKWGPDDEIGALNYNTPGSLVAAARLVKQGKIIPCSFRVKPASYPLWGMRVGIERFMNWSGRDIASLDKPWDVGFAYSDEIIKVGTHSMTHVDPLVHVFHGDKVYNGYNVEDVITHDEGTLKGNANAYIAHSAQRGVLLDVAKFKGVDYLGGKYIITPKDLDDTAKMQGVKIKPGDAILIRTGFMKHWSDRIVAAGGMIRWNAMKDGHAGPGGDCIAWANRHKIGLMGADNISVEQLGLEEKKYNKKYGVKLIPLHIGMLSLLGIPLQELLDLEALSEDCAKDGVYEFLYVWPPLNFWNATGGLISPIAIK